MNKTVFLDADVILDLLARREPWFAYSAQIFTDIQTGKYYGATSVVVFANVFYILRKIKGQTEARIAIKKLKSLLNIMVTTETSLQQAIESNFSDFEDALQYYTAQNNGANILITRNIKDYKAETLSVMTPEQYLHSMGNFS